MNAKPNLKRSDSQTTTDTDIYALVRDIMKVPYSKSKAREALGKALHKAYRRGYRAGHMKGSYGKSKRLLKFTAHNICPVCKDKQLETAQEVKI